MHKKNRENVIPFRGPKSRRVRPSKAGGETSSPPAPFILLGDAVTAAVLRLCDVALDKEAGPGALGVHRDQL